MKIVINACFGGFELSYPAMMRYAEIKGFPLFPFLDSITKSVYKEQAIIGNPKIIHHYSKLPLEGLPSNVEGDPQLPFGVYFSPTDIPRGDPTLIQVIQELGKVANGRYANLKIVDIPNGIEWEIEEYDGSEHVAEKHETWS